MKIILCGRLQTKQYKSCYTVNFFCAIPLGNKVKKCKISAFYFVLGNLPREKRSVN